MEKFSTKAAIGLSLALGTAFAVACWRLNVVSDELKVARDKIETADSLRAEVTALKGELQYYRSRQIVGEVLGTDGAKSPIQGEVSATATSIIGKISRAGSDLDQMFAAAGEAGILDPSAREEVIRWLKESVARGELPSMYLIARMQASAGEMDDAVQWMLAGNVMAAVDADRYEDKSSLMAALHPVQQRLEDVVEHARDRREMQKGCIRAALDIEDQQAKRAPAQWLATLAHDGAGQTAVPVLLPDGVWQDRRRETRTAFQRLSGR